MNKAFHAAVMTFAIVGSLEAQNAYAGDAVTPCDIKVFSVDTDPKGTNVRSGPGAEHGVLALIADQDSEMEVTGISGKWLRIRHAEGVGGKVFFKGEGWVFAGLMGVTARSKTVLHATPDVNGAVVGSMVADDSGVVSSCSGQWVQVQAKNIKGWMAPNTHCGNPVTTCN